MQRADSFEKTLMAGKDWGQEEKGTTEDEMVGWHHQTNGHEFEYTPGVGEDKEVWRDAVHGVAKSWTHLSDWTELNSFLIFSILLLLFLILPIHNSFLIFSIIFILMRRTDSFENTWCWERLKAGGEGDDRGWDGWMASLTQWTWVWVNSRSWWWQGCLACCRPWGRKESDTTERLNWTELILPYFYLPFVLTLLQILSTIKGRIGFGWIRLTPCFGVPMPQQFLKTPDF